MILPLLAAVLTSVFSPQDTIRLATPEEAAATAAAFAPYVPPSEGDWRMVWTSPDGVTALDVIHVEEDGSTRSVWIATAGESTANLPNAPGAYAMVKLELDCASAAARPLWFTIRAASGANIFGHQPAEEPRAYRETSGGEAIAGVVCRGERLDGPGFPTHQAFAASVIRER